NVREGQARALRASARDGEEADAGEAKGDQGRTEATPAPAHPRTGAVVRARGARALPLLRRARQHQGGQHVPRPSSASLVHGASATQPTREPGLGTKAPPSDSTAPTWRPSLLARLARTHRWIAASVFTTGKMSGDGSAWT